MHVAATFSLKQEEIRTSRGPIPHPLKNLDKVGHGLKGFGRKVFGRTSHRTQYYLPNSCWKKIFWTCQYWTNSFWTNCCFPGSLTEPSHQDQNEEKRKEKIEENLRHVLVRPTWG